jgi:hypothetical protein
MPASNPLDPWSIDYFNPPNPQVSAPEPRARAPKMVPGLDDLFTVQRNALKVLNDLHALDHELKGKIPNKLLRDAEHTYRVIRTYLENHS